MKDFERIVVVTTASGEKFLGWIPKGEDPVGYMDQPTVKIEDARLVAVQQQPRMNPQQQIVGISTLVALLQVDMFPGAVPNYRLRPAAWYFPFENPETKTKIEQLLKKAEENEKINQASEAGLHIPGRS